MQRCLFQGITSLPSSIRLEVPRPLWSRREPAAKAIFLPHECGAPTIAAFFKPRSSSLPSNKSSQKVHNLNKKSTARRIGTDR
jgi:hypothetical protein